MKYLGSNRAKQFEKTKQKKKQGLF
uniref:Uncharacterized protein n=1 Tax=Anguilla anguilla TaxID=7936 RepID=A0A0E9T9L6_ANGAN